jgi:hypothetical protein
MMLTALLVFDSWPGPGECAACVQEMETDKAPSSTFVLDHLQGMYWSPAWILTAVRNSSLRERAMASLVVLTRSVAGSDVDSHGPIHTAATLTASMYPSSLLDKQWFLYFVIISGLLCTAGAIHMVAYKQSKVSNLLNNKRAH